MKVLVVGGGGREHALAWKISRSPRVDEIYCAPGNGGTLEVATNVHIGADDIQALADFAQGEGIDLTVVGPEVPLVRGIGDEFARRGLRLFGPGGAAAAIEGEKSLAKTLMAKYGIPTADFAFFTEAEPALRYLRQRGTPIVIKADGLAAGKGVVVAQDTPTAERTILDFLKGGVLGQAGKKIVLEEYLQGQEASAMAVTDGQTVLPLAPARDYKRIGDGDTGPNTGGMGAYSPLPDYPSELAERVEREILRPTVRAMAAEGRPFHGVLYAGLMLTREGPKVLEFNARLGDPEAQVLLPRLANDLVEVMEATLEGRLADIRLQWREEAAVGVVLASGGYPGLFQRGVPVVTEGDREAGVHLFQAGTTFEDGQLVTSGGRVMTVTALGEGLPQARTKAYQAVEKVRFEGRTFRRDIARGEG
ncbi:MAG: phosphoribosylamine--glycine ligase [Firmicutes bacterium]|nr:phosphoribosylamine--glycine ligase [Bacillota bacterium]